MATRQKASKPTGRPSGYTDKLGLKICEWIAEGKSLRAFCREKGSPSQSMVHRWLLGHDEFREKYTFAREVQADTFVDEIIEIADSESMDPAVVQRDRLRVDARKWAAAKQRPKKYGDRAEVNLNADHQHHHSVESVSETNLWLARLFGDAADSEAPKPLPN